MKTKAFILAILALVATACDDFLEPVSLSTFDRNYVFSNVDDARRGVNAIYVHFSHDGFRSRLSNNMTGNTDIEHSSGWTSSGARYQIWDLNAQENNGDLQFVWEIGYQAIRDANIAIEGLRASGTLESEDVAERATMNHLLGEAYTLRAYWYSMLIYFFGDVPFTTEAPKAGVDFNQPREDRNVILTTLINDLIDVEENMMWASEAPYGIEQVNREYTLGMIARLALQRGGWYLAPDMTMQRESDYLDYYQIARDYSKKLMDLNDRQLPEDYRQVFLNQSKFISPTNSEILFEVPFAIGEGDVGWNIGITVEGGDHPFGAGNNYMSVPATYYYSFDKQDQRRDVTVALYKINSEFQEELITIDNLPQGKWSRHFLEQGPGASTSKGTGINWPMMRYADVLLMFAEAENELNGPTREAQEALRRVRQRAFDEAVWDTRVEQYITNASASKEDFFNAIVDERAWEFGGEMIRKYELIRWNLYEQKAQETVEGLKQLADDAFNGTGDLPDYIYWKYDESGDLVILNPDEKLLAAPDETWQRSPWLISLKDEVLGYDEWITRDWANYTAPVRYVFPLPTVAIANSQGVLQNNGYGF